MHSLRKRTTLVGDVDLVSSLERVERTNDDVRGLDP